MNLPGQGTLQPGLTLVAAINTDGSIVPFNVTGGPPISKALSFAAQGNPAPDLPFYDAGSIVVNGQLYGIGGSSQVAAAPEPGSLTLLVASAVSLAAARAWRRSRGAAGLPADA
jgi:hypothetical protein